MISATEAARSEARELDGSPLSSWTVAMEYSDLLSCVAVGRTRGGGVMLASGSQRIDQPGKKG